MQQITRVCRLSVVPHLLACIVHNVHWLESNLSTGHPFFATELYVEHMDALRALPMTSGKPTAEQRAIETGVSIGMKTTLRVAEMSERVAYLEASVRGGIQRPSAAADAAIAQQPATSLESPVSTMQAPVACSAPTARQPKSMFNVLAGLGKNFTLQSYSVDQFWRMWWRGQSPFPLRFIANEMLKTDAEKQLLTRYRKVAAWIRNSFASDEDDVIGNPTKFLNDAIARIQKPWFTHDAVAATVYNQLRTCAKVTARVSCNG